MRLRELATTHVIAIGAGESIDTAINLMEEYNIHHLPVVSERKVVGMLSDRDILTTVGGHRSDDRRLPDGTVTGPLLVRDIMSKPVYALPTDASLHEATDLMVRRRIHAIPLVESNELVGILSAADVLTAVIASPDFSDDAVPILACPVVELLEEDIITVEPTMSLDELVDILLMKRIRHLPVVDHGTLLGIISDRDIRRALAESSIRDAQAQEEGRIYFGSSQAQEIMTTQPLTIPSSMTLRRTADELLSNRIHSVPVVEGSELVGIMTDTDILRILGSAIAEADAAARI